MLNSKLTKYLESYDKDWKFCPFCGLSYHGTPACPEFIKFQNMMIDDLVEATKDH